jgi:hypothetical protein
MPAVINFKVLAWRQVVLIKEYCKGSLVLLRPLQMRGHLSSSFLTKPPAVNINLKLKYIIRLLT